MLKRRDSNHAFNRAQNAEEGKLSLKNRRAEYVWPATRISEIRLFTDKKSYSLPDTIHAEVRFRIIGGLREAFHPDIWTVAWEDFDKILRLTLRVTLGVQGTIGSRTLAGTKKEVRKASFYWSRDPDLPYRIWAMIVPEDGGPPNIPRSVEDAKAKMLDIEKEFQIQAAELGPGTHRLVAGARARWGRRSFIDKGDVASRSKPLVIRIE
jgi:hypothetical protein